MTTTTQQQEERLLDETAEIPTQAIGGVPDTDNVHVAPSRHAAVVAETKPDQELQILGRRMQPRDSADASKEMGAASLQSDEAWYLVREGPQVGWILGRLVQLDIPKSISAYTQETNLVAWLTLDTVDDDGHPVPQYLLADRMGTNACDFTHIRVLTWWKRKQTYAVAYREGGFQGYFPILVNHQGSVPYFRLRLADGAGHRFQKIYGLFDTITRVVGSADTWQSDAMPNEPALPHHSSRLRTKQR